MLLLLSYAYDLALFVLFKIWRLDNIGIAIRLKFYK